MLRTCGDRREGLYDGYRTGRQRCARQVSPFRTVHKIVAEMVQGAVQAGIPARS